MKPMLHRTLPLAVASLLALPWVGSAQTVERHVIPGGDVAVYNLAGNARIERASGSAIEVEIVRRGRDADALEVETGEIDGRQTLRVIYPDDRIIYPAARHSNVRVRVRRDGTFYDRGHYGPSARRVTVSGRGRGLEAWADVVVRVPEGMQVALYQAAGDVRATGVTGDVRVDVGTADVTVEAVRGTVLVDTGAGDVRVRDTEGDVTIDTGSGDVEVEHVRGRRLVVDTGSGAVRGTGIAVERLNVDTGSGRVTIDEVQSESVLVDTGSGSVTLGLLGAVRDLEIDTGSGRVTLAVPASIAARLEIDTGSGGIDVDLPMTIIERRRNYLLARLGEGTGSIRIDTGSGSVNVRPTRPTT